MNSHQDAKCKLWMYKYNKANLSIKTGSLLASQNPARTHAARVTMYIRCAWPTTQAHSYGEPENSPLQRNKKVFNNSTGREREREWKPQITQVMFSSVSSYPHPLWALRFSPLCFSPQIKRDSSFIAIPAHNHQ